MYRAFSCRFAAGNNLRRGIATRGPDLLCCSLEYEWKLRSGLLLSCVTRDVSTFWWHGAGFSSLHVAEGWERPYKFQQRNYSNLSILSKAWPLSALWRTALCALLNLVCFDVRQSLRQSLGVFNYCREWWEKWKRRRFTPLNLTFSACHVSCLKILSWSSRNAGLATKAVVAVGLSVHACLGITLLLLWDLFDDDLTWGEWLNPACCIVS